LASRWTKDQIKSIALEQFEFFWNLDTGIVWTQLSQVESARNVPHDAIVSGLRRTGKSTLLALMIAANSLLFTVTTNIPSLVSSLRNVDELIVFTKSL
jgi:predicted AAA+ superfamily ATPase